MSALSSALLRLHSLPSPYAPNFDDRLLISLLLALSLPSPAHLVLRIGTPADNLTSVEKDELAERVQAELRWVSSPD